ncbi:MAG: energy-coupling factor transporter transmembrane protein EcfT [Treponema sp.]|nr:energy-coupling factor transporter transmembrane protein EcfT [Treponema sp.]
MEFITSARERRSLLDPRTKLFLLVLVSVIVLGSTFGSQMIYLRTVLYFLPFVLLLADCKFKTFFMGVCTVGFGMVVEKLVLPHLSGFGEWIALFVAGTLTRFAASILMASYVVTTTTVSEFICAMKKMHVPDAITIPLSVMFRFFPSICEEVSSINKAMKMRGIALGGGKAVKMIEYRIIPMMICSVKIGEELSAAALSRGLCPGKKRSNICTIGFRAWDVLAVIVVIGAGVCSCLSF